MPVTAPATVPASFYDAPTRRSFASRHKATLWGRCFQLTYTNPQGRKITVHARCMDYGPQAWTKRDIDVSRDVAERQGWTRRGVVPMAVRKCNTHKPLPKRSAKRRR